MGSINSNNLVYYINYIQVHTIVIWNPDSDIVNQDGSIVVFPISWSQIIFRHLFGLL